MSTRLTTAIDIGQYAQSILRQARGIEDDPNLAGMGIHERMHIGIEPMLLALAMEFALKAWWAFDHDDPEIPQIHNLIKLFELLSEESQEKLSVAYVEQVAPYNPEFFFMKPDIRNLLTQHANAFVEWRYIHERKRAMQFETGHFAATVDVMLSEFRKRYRIEKHEPVWSRI